MYHHILVPLDGSKVAEEVVPSAIAMAEKFGAKVTLLNVFEVIPLLPSDKEREFETLKSKGEKYLAEIQKRFDEHGVPAQTVLQTGDPALVICRHADEEDIDLVIMSAHGYGNIERWTLGSVSDKVLRHSPKPVLLVRSASRDLLRGRSILVVDDEPDVLEAVEEELDMCVVHKASSYESAQAYLREYRFDLVILDIMGVNGFEILKQTVALGIPTIMFTAHALTSESLSKSAKLGAVSFLPKEKISELTAVLTDILENSGRPAWKKLFGRMAPYLKMRFGWSTSEEKKLLDEIERVTNKN